MLLLIKLCAPWMQRKRVPASLVRPLIITKDSKLVYYLLA